MRLLAMFVLGDCDAIAMRMRLQCDCLRCLCLVNAPVADPEADNPRARMKRSLSLDYQLACPLI